MKLTREALLMKLGAAQSKAPAAWRLVSVESASQGASFGLLAQSRKAQREVRRREGRYLLRTNLTETDPAKLWEFYLQLVAVEEAFKTLKGDLAIRPDLPSGRAAHRGAHLHRLPRLLPARDARPSTESARARADAAQRCWRSSPPCR